ncbi:MAG: nucleotidyltransferase domain-containing protein [Candidatus Nanoarchaeia archaeon]
MKSKEHEVLKIFYNNPTKHWHFSMIKKEVKLPDNKISRWLKIFEKQNLIKKIKEKNKAPYYLGNYESAEYQNSKKIFALKMFYDSGFLNHLTSLEGAKTVILFGSFSRWDWHNESDIDLFIYGDDSKLKKYEYEKILKREIQIFNCKNSDELQKFNVNLMHSIIKGLKLKGSIDFIEVQIDAKHTT